MNIPSRGAMPVVGGGGTVGRPPVTSIVIDSQGSRPAGTAIALSRYGSLRSARGGGNNSSVAAQQQQQQRTYAIRWDCESLGRERSPSDNGSESDDDPSVEYGGVSKQACLRAEATAAAIAYSRALRAAANAAGGIRDSDIDCDQHMYSEPQLPPYMGSPSPMATYGPLPSNRGGGGDGRPASRNNLGITGGTLPRFASVVASQNTSALGGISGNGGTTGPMVPLPNNLHPSHMLEPSKAPPLLRGGPPPPGSTNSHLYHHHQPGGSSAASSAFAALTSRRFSFNFGKSCSSGRHQPIWKVMTIALIFLCLVLLSVVAYKEGKFSLRLYYLSSMHVSIYICCILNEYG